MESTTVVSPLRVSSVIKIVLVDGGGKHLLARAVRVLLEAIELMPVADGLGWGQTTVSGHEEELPWHEQCWAVQLF